MDLKLRGKKALVTGGTRGIGRAVVEALLAEGSSVSFCARHPEQIDLAIKRFSPDGRVDGQAVDIGDLAALGPWIDRTMSFLKELDILVLNAGAMVAANDEKDWQKNFMVDLMGAFRIVSLAKPYLAKAAAKHGDAAIVILSSISGMEAHGPSSYGPIKAALIHYAKGMSRELGSEKIRINVVSPGPVYFKEGYWHSVEEQDPEKFKAMLKQSALSKMATPEEIANAVLFLSSPISSAITGANLVADDGFTVKVPF